MAVFTDVSFDEIAKHIESYDLGTLEEAKGIAEGVENSNYLLTISGSSYILTLFEKRVKPEDLPYFVSLMEHLSKKTIPCPTPLVKKDGAIIGMLKDRPAVIVSFLSGRPAKRIRNDHIKSLGQNLAKMHLATKDYKMNRDNDMSLEAWTELYAKVKNKLYTIRPGLKEEVESQLDWLQEVWPSDLPTGVIHGDLFPDNVFYEQNNVSGIIDFYFACNDFLVYDIAICLNAWCFERNVEFNTTKARIFLSSYNDIRPLSKEEMEALPILASGAAMRFLLTRSYDWLYKVEDALVTPKDPFEYLQKLRFHRGLTHIGYYGLSRDET